MLSGGSVMVWACVAASGTGTFIPQNSQEEISSNTSRESSNIFAPSKSLMSLNTLGLTPGAYYTKCAVALPFRPAN